MMRWSNGTGPCASYGPDCVQVEDNFSDWWQGYIRTVTYRDGRVHTIKPYSWCPHGRRDEDQYPMVNDLSEKRW